MNTKILIYLPVYNAANRIGRTLSCLSEALNHCPDKSIKVLISDNCSTDDTARICTGFASEQIAVEVNSSNIGPVKNVVKGLQVDHGQEKTWIIGDDDLVVPLALKRIVGMLDHLAGKGQSPRFVHTNILVVDQDTYAQPELVQHMSQGTLRGFIMNRRYQGPTLGTFDRLVDVDVDNSILGAIMCSIFDARAVRQALEDVDFEGLGNWDRYNTFTSRTCFPHAYIFSKAFTAKDPCLIDPQVSVLCSVGHQGWWDKRDRIIGIGSLDSAIEFHESGVIDRAAFDSLIARIVAMRNDEYDGIIRHSMDILTERQKEALLRGYAGLVTAQNHSRRT